jgi:Spy/CpxP family protein refolding chaperone
MFKRLSIVALLFVFVFSIMSAQEKTEKVGRKPMGLFGKLNLTDEQKSKMRDFKVEQAKKQIALRSKIEIQKVEAKQLITADKIDRLAIEKKANEIAKLGVEAKMLKLDGWIAVNNILTPEQQKIWKNALNINGHKMKMRMMKNRMGRGMRNHMGRGMGEAFPNQPDQPNLSGVVEHEDQLELIAEFGDQLPGDFDEEFFLDPMDPPMPPEPIEDPQ